MKTSTLMELNPHFTTTRAIIDEANIVGIQKESDTVIDNSCTFQSMPMHIRKKTDKTYPRPLFDAFRDCSDCQNRNKKKMKDLVNVELELSGLDYLKTHTTQRPK